MIGTILDGRYRILRRLGQGSMGEIYLAEHITLMRQQALKILRANYADQATFVSRFRREARANDRLRHPNIVAFHDFGELPDGRFYLSTEYVEGTPLDLLLKKQGWLPLGRTLHVLHQLAAAVAHAHECGVIHRDLKPGNLILVEYGDRADVLKVLDFGIAKIIAPGYQETAGITAEGDVFGTVEYMSPEQIAGNSTDPRIDLYAIGCIAYELIVGVPPFAGRDVEVMHQHVHTPPPIASQLRPGIQLPPAFDALVARCLEKTADRRFQSAREIMKAIEAVPGYDPKLAKAGRPRPPSAPMAAEEHDAQAFADTLPPGDANVATDPPGNNTKRGR